MTRSSALGASLMLLFLASPLLAQVRRQPAVPNTQPTTSPFLNLNRGGNPAINYYNLVRPEFEFRNAYRGLQTEINRQQSEIQNAAEAGLPATGHNTTFLNYSHYFPSKGGVSGASGGRAQGAAPSAPSPRR